MRKIIYWVHTSIDGYIAGPHGEFDWPALGPELFGYSEAMNEQVDTLMYGRVVWDMMASYWPTADADPATTDDHARAFAPFWRETPKVVVSRTLEKASWDARVIGKNLAAEVEELKRRPGKDILLTGGAEVAASSPNSACSTTTASSSTRSSSAVAGDCSWNPRTASR